MRSGSLAVALLFLLTHPLSAQSDDAFVEWVRGRAVAVDENGQAFRTLDHAVAGARLIGVGESVHEVQPFVAFRFALLRDLVRRHRVTALVLESGLPEVTAVNDYVHGRAQTLDFNAALPGYFGPLEEMHKTIEWLREWNRGEGRSRPVSVYGADLPARQGSVVPALDRLRALLAEDRVVVSLIDSLRPTAARVSSSWWKGSAQKYDALTDDEKASFARNVSLLVDRVNHLTLRDRETVEWARRLALVLQQGEASLRLGVYSPVVPRDHAMAENTLWVLERLRPGEKAVYWAHNAHVQRVPVKGPAVPPGQFLTAGSRFDAVLGREYLAIATAYGGPAMDDKTAAAAGSVDAALEKLAADNFILPLRSEAVIPADVSAWLSTDRAMRFQNGYLTLPLATAFDAVVYFDHAVPATRASLPPGK